ncbi:hypothetical protein MTR67_017146, partial [Solanum verrucosum]
HCPSSSKIYVIGEEGILEELEQAGFTALGGPADGKKNIELKSDCLFEHDKNVGAVIVGLDLHISMLELQLDVRAKNKTRQRGGATA